MQPDPPVNRLRKGLRAVRKRLRDGQIRRIMRDASVTTFSSLIAAALGIVRASLLTHYLGLEGYGLLGIAIATPAVVRGFLSPRTWEWVVVELSKARKAKDPGLGFGFVRVAYLLEGVMALLSVALVLILARPIADSFLHDPTLASLILLGVLIDATVFPQAVATAVIRVVGDFKWLAWFRIAVSVAGLSAIGAVILLDLGLEGVMWAFLAQSLAGTVWILPTAHFMLRRDMGRPDAVDVKGVFAEGRRHLKTLFFLSVTTTAKLISTRIEQPLIALLSSPATVGLYRVAFIIAEGLYQLVHPLYVVYHVEMNKVAADRDRTRLRKLVRDFSLFGLALGTAVGLGSTLFGPYVIGLLFGPEFHDAGPLLQLMGWTLLAIAGGWQHPLFIAEDKAGRVLAASLCISIARVVLLLSLVPAFLEWGAAIAYLASNLSFLLILPVLVRGTWVFDGWQVWRRIPEEQPVVQDESSSS